MVQAGSKNTIKLSNVLNCPLLGYVGGIWGDSGSKRDATERRQYAMPPSARITVRVQPRARRTEVVGVDGTLLRVRVAALPERGGANEALIYLLAGSLQVPVYSVAILRGHKSRSKVVEVAGMTHSEALRRLSAPKKRG